LALNDSQKQKKGIAMAESRTNKAGKNITYSVALKSLVTVINFISRMIFVKVLDESFLGINGLFINIISVLSLADLGIGTAMTYSLYQPLADKDDRKVISLVNFFRKVYLRIACAVGLLGLLLLPFLKYLVNLSEPVPHLKIYYLLFLLQSVSSYLFVYRSILLTADQKEYIISKCTMLFQLITFAVKTAVLFITANYILYLLFGILCDILNNFTVNLIAKRSYPYLVKSEFKLNRKEKKNIYENVKSLFVYKLAGVFQTNMESILISVLISTVLLGYYSIYTMVIANISGIIYIIFNSVKASVGNLVAEEMKKDTSYAVFQTMEFVNFWIVGFCSIAFVVLFQDFVTIAFGQKFVIPFLCMITVVSNFYITNIRQSIWAYREATGLFKQTKYITIISTVMNLVLSATLGLAFKMIGILVGTVISRMLYAWWKEPVILFREYFHKPVKGYFINYVSRALVCMMVCAITLIICNYLPEWDIRVVFIIKLLVCVLVPNLLFLLIYCRSREFKVLMLRYRSQILHFGKETEA
jgi:O-antigen/teichoic acid export membrane protein